MANMQNMTKKDYITKLHIRIKLDGNISGYLDYNYELNTDMESKYNTIYFTTKYLLNKDLLKQSNFADKRKIFLDYRNFKNFLRTIPSSVRNKSKEKLLTDEGKTEIIQNNIQLILPLFFKRGAIFYLKGNEFIIDNNNIDSFNLRFGNKSSDDNNLLSYDDLEQILIDRYKASEILVLKKKQARLQKVLKLYEADNDEKAMQKFIKEYPLVEYSDARLKLEAETNISKKLEVNNDIERLASKKISELNNKPYNLLHHIKYKYVKNVGIKPVESKSRDTKCIITLFLIDKKTRRTGKIRYNCRSRKNEIKKTLNKLIRTKKYRILGTEKYKLDNKSKKNFFYLRGTYKYNKKYKNLTNKYKSS